MDQRMEPLARQLIHHAIALQAGEKILLDLSDGADDFGIALLKEIYTVGGIPFLNQESAACKRAWLMGLTETQGEMWYQHEVSRMKQMDAYIAIRKQMNPSELSDIPEERMLIHNKFHGRLHLEERCRNTRWCVLGYPSPTMAHQAGMSTEAFEDYYYRVCSLDYAKLSLLMQPLKTLMDQTRQVEITAKGTHLSFSMEGCASGICDGHANIPDGEVCTAVMQESVNGTITYNIPSNYQGFLFTEISLTFLNGKVIQATANDTGKLNGILDLDEGARYIGEFAIGVNPYVDRAIGNTLFDEKMTGSIHLATGYGGKRNSVIHWDMIQSHLPACGGGEIRFDGRLIRKDGLFVVDELQALNPSECKKVLEG